jgi:drug/metabolite transporter (DMT)-like permease
MNVVISMGIAVIIWSLYPLAATIGLQSMGSLEMILVVYYFSGIGSLLLGGHYLWKNNLFAKAYAAHKQLNTKAYILIAMGGIAGVLCHGFFILSLTLANKGGASLLFESWPVIAVVATPFLMKKTWKEVSLKEFLTSVFALVGVAIIVLSDESLNIVQKETKLISDSMDMAALGGYILAFSGGYMCAVLVVTKGAFAEYFTGLKNDTAAVLISEIYTRILSMALMSIAFIVLHEKFDFGAIHWEATFYIGFIVFVVGGALYTYALINTDRPTIHIIYYFVPVLAVVWLWLTGHTTINTGLFIGGGIILLCNIYLVYAGRKARLSEE